MEVLELEAHRSDMVADLEKLVEKYRAIFTWDVPDVDQVAADKLILATIHNALNHLEGRLDR